MDHMKLITLGLTLTVLSLSVNAQTTNIALEIATKKNELAALQSVQRFDNQPMMFAAVTEMVKASSKCMADGIANKSRLTRTASVSKGCREQAQLGAFGICSIVAESRDLNQCTAMMKSDGLWEQVWMRGIGVAGALYGGKLASDIVLKGALPIAIKSLEREPTAPVIVRPEVINPIIVETPDPLIVNPIVIQPAAPVL